MISLALNFDQFGPQGGKTNYPPMGRINPLHLMLRTGTDAYSGVLDKRGIRASDDVVVMPLQSGTQWDGLGHIFYENYMWNGYDCREVTTAGAQKCGIEKTKNKMVGRGVFLDVPRALGKEELDDGYAITSADLEKTAKAQGVTIKRGDFVIVRTGQMERCLRVGSWDGYPGGDAPGFSFETLEWVHKTEIAAIASDTWGCEVRPNESRGRHQPALALDHHPDHGHHHGRNLQRRRARQGLHGRQDLRVHVRRPGDPDHRRGRLAGQPARDQVTIRNGHRPGLARRPDNAARPCIRSGWPGQPGH